MQQIRFASDSHRTSKFELLENRRVLASIVDFNSDGVADIQDIDTLAMAISRNSDELTYDLNFDGALTNSDLDVWRSVAAYENGFSQPYRLGDANLDGTVDASDLGVLARNWQATQPQWSMGNFVSHEGGTVDQLDLNALAINWNREKSREAFFAGQRVAFDDQGGDVIETASGDFNGDGKIDLAATTHLGNLAILIGRGDGTFSKFSEAELDPFVHAGDLVAADLNSDGLTDLALGSFSGEFTVLMSRGDGTFLRKDQVAGPYDLDRLTVGDFNGDDVADLATTRGNKAIAVFLGRGDGTFDDEKSSGVGKEPLAIASGDFNSDGLTDLATANTLSKNVSVLLSLGDGTFEAQTTLVAEDGPRSLATGDFNDDGVIDLAVGSQDSDYVAVHLGKNDGTFDVHRRFPLLGEPHYSIRLTAGDFNGDGVTDLVSNIFRSSAGIWLSQGEEMLATRQQLEIGYGVATTGDFNGDGLTDMAMVNSDSFAVFLSQDIGIEQRAAKRDPRGFLVQRRRTV